MTSPVPRINAGEWRPILALLLCLAVTLGWAGATWADQAQHEGHESADPGAKPDAFGAQEAAPADHSAHQSASHGDGHEDAHAGHGTGPVDEAGTFVRGGFTRAEEKAYSLFMHRSCGLALIGLGLLILADRLTQRRHGAIRKGMGIIWLLMGVHILWNADPTDWPVVGTFMESLHRPGSSEWLQHKVLSLIPMAIGLYAVLVPRREKPNPSAGFVMAAILALGGIALLYHEHEHSPGMDMALIVKQHTMMAMTALFIAAGWLADSLERLSWKPKFYLVPIGLILIGLELAIYTE
ncbi:MAG: hypothetical protein EPO64_14405 [Nitrospirae bacterium]|nr:MAG: hypothetical protein EPO64_14405 [Nitrospirota bacterium]